MWVIPQSEIARRTAGGSGSGLGSDQLEVAVAVGRQVGVSGFRLVSVVVDELRRPVPVAAGHLALLVVAVDRNDFVAVRDRGKRAPQGDHIHPAGGGGTLHERDDRFLVFDIVQYAITDDHVILPVRREVPDVGRGDAQLGLGFLREVLDLFGAYRAYLHGV